MQKVQRKLQLAYIFVAVDSLTKMPLLCGQLCNTLPFLAVLQTLIPQI